ncbi:4'-phosphopantetheinyl transferase family protein [Psychromicrobium xiongbiense]|uniref:4'-phosphopantetheinyl transferase family protein n=1 Tax=Psychromicrobium xiongbiense TaxID=3051184 RepID=UPI002556DAC8|nr:4'-phosphopantetheinyl transferase superfamily protein [Psychromicrobium sp. YIM S02556]
MNGRLSQSEPTAVGGSDVRWHGEVAVRAVRLDRFHPQPEELSWLTPAETGRAGRLVALRDRRNFQRRRIALRYFVAELAGVSPGSLMPSYVCPVHGEGGDHGRPGFHGVPGSFSATSSQGWAMMAGTMTAGLRVGVDCERNGAADFAGFTRLMHPAEQVALVRCETAADRSRFRTECWAATEAWLKLRGTGLQEDPAAVDTVALRSAGTVELLDAADYGLPESLVLALAVG